MTSPTRPPPSRYFWHWLWRRLHYFWITIVFEGLVLGIILANFTIKWILDNILLAVTFGIILIFLTIVSWIFSRRSSAALGDSAVIHERRDRKAMLERVRSIWITGILEQSLHNAAFITLGLHEQPGLIENPWRLVLQEVDQPARLLPSGTSITQVYDEAGGELLILGEPGSGKTTLLLQLTRDLLERARLDETHPIPIVFNLSSWAVKRQPLAKWLVEELSIKYQVPQKLGKLWVDTGQVFPLLDGLDEVAKQYRAACVGSINAYRQKQGLIPLVVCSRTAEYLAQETKVLVRRAVVIQPLTGQQIDAYLERAGGRLTGLQVVLHDDPNFQELAQTPLMLSILSLTYSGKSAEGIAHTGSITARRLQVFAAYVQRMFQRRGIAIRYTAQQTMDWLTWLAKQMVQRDQPLFYLERLQMDWLSDSRPYQLSISLAIGLLSFLIMIPVSSLLFENFLAGTLVSLLDAAIAILFVWLIETGIHRDVPLFSMKKGRPTFVGEGIWSRGRLRLIPFFTRLLGDRVVFAFFSGLLDGMLVQLLIGPFYAWVHGLFYAIFYIVLGKLERHIQPAEILHWSWASVRRNALKSFLQGVGTGFLLGLSNALFYGQFVSTLSFGLCLGAAIGIIIMLMRGFSSDILDTQKKIKPNQGIRNSFSNGIRIGLLSGLALGVVVFLYYSLVINFLRVGYMAQLPPHSGLIYGVSDGLAVAYLYWLKNGGFACVQHLVLRTLLWQTKCTPWRYPRFLDYAHERILLRKAGGGYMFIHKLLLEYFADLYRERR